jgi:hypothetical protein
MYSSARYRRQTAQNSSEPLRDSQRSRSATGTSGHGRARSRTRCRAGGSGRIARIEQGEPEVQRPTEDTHAQVEKIRRRVRSQRRIIAVGCGVAFERGPCERELKSFPQGTNRPRDIAIPGRRSFQSRCWFSAHRPFPAEPPSSPGNIVASRICGARALSA